MFRGAVFHSGATVSMSVVKLATVEVRSALSVAVIEKFHVPSLVSAEGSTVTENVPSV